MNVNVNVDVTVYVNVWEEKNAFSLFYLTTIPVSSTCMHSMNAYLHEVHMDR